MRRPFRGRTAPNSVEAIEVVRADGRIAHVDRDHDRDLFWALRGGGDSFGVVTAIEFRLLAITEVYAGLLWWPIERGVEVIHSDGAGAVGRVGDVHELCGDSARPRALWSEHRYRPLRQIKARVDPDDLIRSNHPIPPA